MRENESSDALNVTVNEGGQEIVGNVSQGVGAAAKMEGNPMNLVQRMNAAPRCSSHEQSISAPMPGSGGPGLEGVQVPRRTARSANG